jgi:diamine N-acetyltransferase
VGDESVQMSKLVPSIKLRPFTRQDREVTLSWRNMAEVRDAVMGFRYPVTDVMEDRWYDKVLDGSDKSQVYFAIELLENAALIGFCSLTDIDYQSSHAQFGIMIGDTSQQNCGVGAQALAKTLEFAFGSLNLRRVYVLVRAANGRAQNLFTKAGFVSEGTMREHYFQDGEYDDVVIMGLLKRDYLAIVS